MWSHSAQNFFSVTVSVANTTLSTNGKGTTAAYALASAYGELMERLQNFAPYHLNTDVSQDAMEYQNFFYAPDENWLSDDDLLNSQEEWMCSKLAGLDATIDKQNLLNLWKEISYETIPCDFIALPFLNLNNKKTSYIPIKMLSKMYMSNGMCAGNTPEEALVQGISETIERYINKRIIKEHLTPPTIPNKFLRKYPRIQALISEIESNGNFEVILKDCTLGCGFPVIGVIFVDKDTQSYFVKFGSHPTFEISVERTLTELLQGQNIKKMRGTWEYSYQSKIEDQYQNMMNILVNGCGEYPAEFFGKEESFAFHPPVDLVQMSNEEMLHYLIGLLKGLGYDVLARNVSFLGFPCFHVIIPGFSEIEEIDDTVQLKDYVQFIKMKKMIRDLKCLNDKQLADLSHCIDERHLGLETPVMEFLNLQTCPNLPWYYTNFDLLSVAIDCILGKYESALRRLNNIIISLKENSGNAPMITYYKCFRDYIAAKADGRNDHEAIEILSAFYPIQMIRGVISEIGDSERIFEKHRPICCFHCSTCNLQSVCPYIETERTYRVLKEKYAHSGIDNTSLLNILKN